MAARQARDDGLRRIRTITWRIGLVSAAVAAFIGAKFAHITPSLPHLSGNFSGDSAGTGASSTGSSPNGVAPGYGGGVVVSGGS